MRRLKLIFLAAIMAVFVSGCSSEGSLPTPVYKSSSALYQITQAGSTLSSVEFTESGNYVIVRKSSRMSAAQNNDMVKAETMWLLFSPWSQPQTRSTAYNNIITGKYTKTDDTTYVLEGFGTITVKGNNGTNYSLVITETGSSPYTLTAAKKDQFKDSEPTGKLCRTWHISGMRIQMSVSASEDGQSFSIDIDEEVDGGNMAELLYKVYETTLKKIIKESGQSVPETQIKMALAEQKKEFESTYPYVEGMIFTQAGTYMVTYKDETLAIATWKWTGDDFKKIHYSWDYAGSSSELSNDCSVEFSGKRCYIIEEKADLNGLGSEFNSRKSKMTYTLEEE